MSEKVLQIRSLRQLILGSFLVALVPLLALLWQSQSDIAKLRATTETNTVFFVNTVSEMQTLNNVALDVERLLLQHFVIPNSTLKQLNDETLSLFRNKLAPFCLEIIKSDACGQLHKNVVQLSDYASMSDKIVLDAHLSSFKSSLSSMREDVNQNVRDRVSQQQNFMSSMQQKQAWSTAVLTILSLILIAFGSQLIVKPVRKLKDIIKAIANNDNKLPAKSSSGPKELIAVERDLYNLHHRMQQLEKVRMALLRHASHELKTPLASMKEGCSLLYEQNVGNLNKNQLEIMGLMNASTNRLSVLIEKLLDYNSLLQQAEAQYTRFDIQNSINECIQDNRLVLLQNRREVVVNITEDERFIVTDPELFRRIFDNLMSNAIAHGRPNTPIQISISGNNVATVIDFSNNGTPISDSERSLIFEPFKRGETNRNDKVVGAGLGLSIVNDCVNILGGDVIILDVDYADVCFRIKLLRREIEI